MNEEFKRFEAAGWSAQAATYDDVTGRATAQAFAPLLQIARVGAGGRVLDIACGLGGLSRAARDGCNAYPVGVDLAPGMLEAARAFHPDVEFTEGDAEALPFADASFDAALGAFVLNHVPEPERVAAEAARVVASGGAVGFAVWDRPERARLTSLLAQAVERAGLDRGAGVPAGPDDARFADPGELERLLEGCGLTEVETATLEVTVKVESLDALWDGLVGGTVRTASAVAAAGDEGRAHVRRELAALAEEFATSGGAFDVPTVIKLGAGRRA